MAHLGHEIFLIDEILTVGDQEFQKKCMEKMMDFKRSGVTIVFVSHSMTNVEMICDRAILIEDHKIKMLGKPEETIRAYTS